MNIIEFGKKDAPVIVLLHGGGLSWWNYREEAELLQENYHVLLPVLDGHAGSDRDFAGIEDNAAEIIRYIDEKQNGSVLMIGGLSLGAQILTEILSVRPEICRTALIESALVIPMKFTGMLVQPMTAASYGLISKKWFARLQFRALGMKEEYFEDYYRDSVKITEKNLISILKANSVYRLKNSAENTAASVHIVVGQKERKKMIRSAELLREHFPDSSLEILPGMFHGEFSLNHAGQYVQKIRELLGSFD